MPEVDKVKLADFVIQNNTDLESLKEFTHQVIDELQMNGFVNSNFKNKNLEMNSRFSLYSIRLFLINFILEVAPFSEISMKYTPLQGKKH